MLTATDAAKAAIGADAPRDWSLKPSEHVRALGPEAGALARVLKRSGLEEFVDTFESADREADKARDRYKGLAGWSAGLSFVAVLLAAAVLLGSSRAIGLGIDLRWLAVVQGAALVVSFVLSFVLAWTRPFDAWMRQRGMAEHQRILFFTRVCEATEPTREDELALLPLQLEYFRRYQLDVQRKYYRERGAEHRRAQRRATALRIVAVLLVVAAALPIAGHMLGTGWPEWLERLGLSTWSRDLDVQQRFFLALSTSGAALQGLLAALALINQDERNAARYAATHENLEALAGRPLDEARSAAAAGDASDVQALVALVQEQISSEHREWVDLRAVAPSLSLRRLREMSLPRLP